MKKIRQIIGYFIMAALPCLTVACGSDDTAKNGKLELKASAAQIVADGADYVTFTVLSGGQDVTSSAEIYKGTARLEGAKFTSDEEGTFRFTAKYQGALSNDVEVKVVAPAKYKKKVVLPVWSSVNCIWCPKMAEQLKNVWQAERPGQTVPMYFHSKLGADDDDPFIVLDKNGKILEGNMAVWFNCIGGLPKAAIDAVTTINYTDGSDRLDIALQRPTYTGIAIETSLDGNTLKVKVRTKADQDYKYPAGLAIWLIENGLVSPQQKGEEVPGQDEPKVEVIEDYVHNYVVRAGLCEEYTGTAIPEASAKAGQEYTYETTYVIPAEYKKENLCVVAYVYQNVPKAVSQSQHQVENVQEVKAGKSIGYELTNGNKE